MGVNSACTSSNVFPLLYGTGNYELKIYDMAEISTDVVVVGQSKINNAAGEGFIMKIDQYGKIVWQKLYRNTGSDSDKIDKVAIHSGSSTIFVAGTSTTSGSNTFFALKLASDGTLSYNLKIGTDTSYVSTTSSITYFKATSATTTETFFQVPTPSTTRSAYSTDTYIASTNAELVKFISGWSTSLIIDYNVVGTKHFMTLAYSNYIICFLRDTSSATNDGGQGLNSVQANSSPSNVY